MCRGCGEHLPLSAFGRASGLYGVRARCGPCHNAREREKAAKRNDAEREKRRQYIRGYIAANREKVNKLSREQRARNPQAAVAATKRWREANPDKVKRLCGTPYFRLRNAVARQIIYCLRGDKGGKRTFELLGYTYDQLREHLERQFSKGMTWDNYGKYGWHLDHIVPITSFEYETPDDPAFKACWALSNLRPLWATDNLSKGARRLLLV